MKVLVYTSPSRGDRFPIVAVFEELHQRGHDVSVRTLASVVPLSRGMGFAADPVSPLIESLRPGDYGATNARAAITRSLGTFGARAPHEVVDLRTAIDDGQPDLVLVDFNCWGAAGH